MSLLRRRMMMGKQGRLPSGYTEIDYVNNPVTTSSGVLNTNLYWNGLWHVKIKFKQDTLSNGMPMASNGSSYVWYYNYYTGSHDEFMLYMRKSGSTIVSKEIYSPCDTDWHEVEYIGGVSSQRFLHNGVELSSLSKDMTDMPDDTTNLCLFGRTTAGASGYNGKIAYVQIWDADGVPIIDYVPCVRDSDNTVGFYDLVNRVFHWRSVYTAS